MLPAGAVGAPGFTPLPRGKPLSVSAGPPGVKANGPAPDRAAGREVPPARLPRRYRGPPPIVSPT